MRFSTGDQVVVVALPIWRPPDTPGTAVREAVAPTDGARPAASYRRSTSVQSSSRPTT